MKMFKQMEDFSDTHLCELPLKFYEIVYLVSVL